MFNIDGGEEMALAGSLKQCLGKEAIFSNSSVEFLCLKITVSVMLVVDIIWTRFNAEDVLFYDF